jgi:hypothetical protein
MQSLKQILRIDYEISSCQKVNLQKSSVFFGKGCPNGLKTDLKQVIGIDNEALSERYLGLPTVVGRSKDRCASYICGSEHGGKLRVSKARVFRRKGKGC